MTDKPSGRVTVRRRSGFSTIPNALIRDTSISADARLLLCYVMSCSDDWTFYVSKCQEVLGCKKDKWQKVRREVINAGYLKVQPKQGADGRLDGYIWEVFDTPQPQHEGEQGGNAAQDVVNATADREPEKPAPGVEQSELFHREPEKTARRCNPPAGKTGSLRITTKQKEQQTSCAADAPHNSEFDFDGFVAEFSAAYPRMGLPEATEDALRAALGEGGDPAEILAGARAYAVEQDGNAPRYVKLSENWIAEKRWRQHVTTPKAQANQSEVLAYWAKEILEAKPHMRGRVSPSMARECLSAGLVTEQDCRQVGVSL
ncbi:helix-turn-helix domain-containing protein [Phaeobacter inhibens]|uniref:helix-turn-helix domain-containing protein n=1 Tax=Phaeobacter inhibens TaxID=221822 RepID=UPI000C9C71E9|nr:helix-turn-helix domain-containing protein [Phaeobacter inhibens]AUQ54531.1 Helix-turn-helix domain protein [Phaeobacter inhibens]AUQ78547.1 Helix-turn-helix domain protein [Phaeobacter inhibens]AUR15706.1 Helix-turn-helix domain protein [Phaeobacter inhibens]